MHKGYSLCVNLSLRVPDMNDRCSDYHIYKMLVRGKAPTPGIFIDFSVEEAVASTLRSGESIVVMVGADLDAEWLPSDVVGNRLGDWRFREVLRAEPNDMHPLRYAVLRRSKHYPNDPNLYAEVYNTTEWLLASRAPRMG